MPCGQRRHSDTLHDGSSGYVPPVRTARLAGRSLHLAPGTERPAVTRSTYIDMASSSCLPAILRLCVDPLRMPRRASRRSTRKICIRGDRATSPTCQRQATGDIAMVFQNYAALPAHERWRTTWAFCAERSPAPRASRSRNTRCREAARSPG